MTTWIIRRGVEFYTHQTNDRWTRNRNIAHRFAVWTNAAESARQLCHMSIRVRPTREGDGVDGCDIVNADEFVVEVA